MSQISPGFFSFPHNWPKNDATNPIFSSVSPYSTPRHKATQSDAVSEAGTDFVTDLDYSQIASERGNCGRSEGEPVLFMKGVCIQPCFTVKIYIRDAYIM